MILSRRRFLTGSAGLIVASVLSQAFPGRFAFASPPLAAAANPSAGFMSLSVLLTGLETPDALLAQRLYSWLSAHHSDLENQMTQLTGWLKQHPQTSGNDLLNQMASQPVAFSDLYKSLVSGWYLGVIGPLPRPDCIGFETIVSYQVVKSSLLPPSYATGKPGFWTHPPQENEHA